MQINKEQVKKQIEKLNTKVKPMMAKVKPVMVSVKTKAVSAYESSNVDFSFMKKVHFNFHHFATLSIVAFMAFFVVSYSTGYNTATVDAEEFVTPQLEAFNEEVISINYGDTDTLANVAKTILTDEVSALSAPKKVSGDAMSAVYELDQYVISVNIDAAEKLGESKANISVETKTTYPKADMEKVAINGDVNKVSINDGAKYTYQVSVKTVDNEAPVISLYSDDTTIKDTDEYTAQEYVKSVTDNVDGIITDLIVENEVPTVDGKLEAGRHDVTIKAKDSSGNESAVTLIVRVKETSTPKATANNTARTNSEINFSSGAGDYAGAGSVVSAAYAQLGRTQDCTMLVTNSLKAVGISYHGWPAGYLSLGTVVSAAEAQPGDILYYADGGAGVAHVAIYVGGGQAIHGGWLGNQTVLTTAYVGSGPVFIRINR